MLRRIRIHDGIQERPVAKGDILTGGDVITALTTAGDGTLTGAVMNSSILKRTGPGGAYTDTTDTAANIIAALGGGNPIQPGTNYRWHYVNGVAQAMTLAAGTNVTLAGTTTIAGTIGASRDYLVEITNGTLQQVFAATVDGSTKVITGMTAAQTQLLSPGMVVTGTGIAASSSIVSIQPGVGVTLNNNTTVAGTNVALTFDPTVTITGL